MVAPGATLCDAGLYFDDMEPIRVNVVDEEFTFEKPDDANAVDVNFDDVKLTPVDFADMKLIPVDFGDVKVVAVDFGDAKVIGVKLGDAP